MKKTILITLLTLGIAVAGFTQTSSSATPKIITKLYKNQRLEEVKRPDGKVEYTLTKDIDDITSEVYEMGAVLVYIRGGNSNENYQALPLTNVYGRLYAFSYTSQSLTIVSNYKDQPIDLKVVILTK